MNIEKLTNQLIEHEGERLKPYLCSAGKLTIGIGHNLDDNGITQEVSRFIFKKDIDDCLQDLERIFPQWTKYPEEIQHVLIDMRFQLGSTRFRRFKKMIDAVRRLDLETAAKEMKDSLWYLQVPARAKRLIEMVKQYIRSETDEK